MIYKEEVRDLFTVPQGYMLAHCISADFNLGGGIAKQFCEHYNMREKLKSEYGTFFDDTDDAGYCFKIDNVYNLVTKRHVYDKPTYESLKEALEDMSIFMKEELQNKVAMPRIGCGLDGLNWNIVKAIIKDVFENTDVEILVCMREEDVEKDTESTDYEDYKYDKTDEYECDCKECGVCSDCHKVDTTLEEELSDEDLEKVYYAILEELEKRHKYM